MKFLNILICLIVFSIFAVTTFSSCCCDPYEPSPQGKGDLQSYFALNGSYLYVIDNNYGIQVYEILNEGTLSKKNTIQVSDMSQSIAAHQNTLLIGTSYGLNVYDISQPEMPSSISYNSIFRWCDPMDFVSNFIYGSIRIRGDCQVSGQDALVISNVDTPASIAASYPSQTPYGLCIDGTTLFLCGGDAGMKVYDITNPVDITLIKQYDDIKGIKAIANSELLIVTADNGIYQYDYADLHDIKLLSQIPIGQ